MPFQPQADQDFIIDGVAYSITEHPAAPGMPYGQEGRAAIVYQLAAPDDQKRALKVFKPRYRSPGLVTLADRLVSFASLPGLRVCRRNVLAPQHHAALLRQYPDLTYAVLMPWVEGPTWMEVMLEKRAFKPAESLSLTRYLIEILVAMEQRNLAHCDLSASNVMLPLLAGYPGVALVDVEGMYGPELQRPREILSGSPGYAHRTAPEGIWSIEADRFSGAVIIAEILGWCDERVRKAAWGENYFDPGEMQQEDRRYRVLMDVLQERWNSGVTGLFERAWHSEMLADCATFGEWLVSLPEKVLEIEEARPVVSLNVQTKGLQVTNGTLETLMNLGQRLLEQEYFAGALEVYQQAQALLPPGSDLAKKLAETVKDLEEKQTVVAVSDLQMATELVVSELPCGTEEAESSTMTDLSGAAPKRSVADMQEEITKLAQIGSEFREKAQAEATITESGQQEEQLEAIDAVSSPATRQESDVGHLFGMGLAAYRSGDWVEAKNLLSEVVRQEPGYRDGQQTAAELLAQIEKRLSLPRHKRVFAWVLGGVGGIGALAALAVVLALGGVLLAVFLSNGPSESTVITEPTAMSTFLADVISPENVSQLYEWRAYESQDFVESAAFSPDNTVLAWGGEGGIWLYNLVDDRELCHLTSHTGQVHSVVFSTDGTRLFSGGVDTGGGKVRVWDWSTCTELWSSSVAPEEWGVWIDLSADGKYLASSGGREVVLWRISESGLEWQETLSVSGGVPTFSPDGTLVAFWETDGGVRIVNIEDGGSYFFEAPSDPEYGPHLAFSPDSSMIAGGAYDGDVRVWRIADGELVYRLEAHDTPVESVAFSPDGQILASGARDGSMSLWQMADGVLYTWDVHTGRARVFFSPDGSILVSGSADSTVRLWRVR